MADNVDVAEEAPVAESAMSDMMRRVIRDNAELRAFSRDIE